MTGAAATEPATLAASPHLLARGFAALRIFFGLIYLSNTLAKVFGFSVVEFGPFGFSLIDRPGARGILEGAAKDTWITPLGAMYEDLVLANWGFFQWFLTVAELGVAAGLLFGIASRAAALGGLLLITPVWVMLWDEQAYLWLYPVDLFPLLLLAIVPAGRVAGLDGRLAARFNGRWPF